MRGLPQRYRYKLSPIKLVKALEVTRWGSGEVRAKIPRHKQVIKNAWVPANLWLIRQTQLLRCHRLGVNCCQGLEHLPHATWQTEYASHYQGDWMCLLQAENKAKLRERHNFSSSSINTLLIKLPVMEGLSIVIHFYGRKWNYNCRQTTLSECTT